MASSWRSGVALLAVGVATACGGVAPVGGSGDERPTGSWVLTEGEHGGAEVPLVDGHDITLTIEDDSWGGTAACNSYGATVTVDGDRLEITELSQTEMACVNGGVMESEAAYLAAFAAVERYVEDGDHLVLEGDAAHLRYEELPPEPEAAPAGGR